MAARVRRHAAITAMALALVACSSDSPTATTATTQYLPGLAARVSLPGAVDRAPLVVMIPGGDWRTADPSGFAGLADRLASDGITAVTVEIRAAEDDVVYPVPVQDVLCALAFASAEVRRLGVEPGPMVLLGHSSGAHLAALAALTPGAFSAECPYPIVEPDALIGLSGVYDVASAADVALALFGPDADDGVWDQGNPMLQAGSHPGLPVLLMHGDDDRVVPPSFTTGFDRMLAEGGHSVTSILVAGADHHSIYTADVSGAAIVDFVASLPR